jgi:hypothetical protein
VKYLTEINNKLIEIRFKLVTSALIPYEDLKIKYNLRNSRRNSKNETRKFWSMTPMFTKIAINATLFS